MKKFIPIFVLLTGCATSQQRQVLESQSAGRPEWVVSTKVSWVTGDQVNFRSQYTIRGDERPNGCFQLARIEVKEALLREVAEDLRGQIDSAQEGLSESAELALTQVRSSEFGGKVTGMRFTEQYIERYATSGVERIDCFVLAEIRKSDYDAIKRQVLYKIAAADPDIKRIMKNRAIKFFATESSP